MKQETRPLILFVGDHPFCATGCANMMRAILDQVDYDKYKVFCFGMGKDPAPLYYFADPPFNIIPVNGMGYEDQTCGQQLLSVIQEIQFDAVIFVGIDIWAYHYIYPHLMQTKKRNKKEFTLCGIFPFDLMQVRDDWIKWFNLFDMPFVYSQYGYQALQRYVPNIQYFRPPLAEATRFERSDEMRRAFRRELSLSEDVFLYGFIGPNQFRKAPLLLMKAFSKVKEDINSALYMHCELHGIYNIDDYAHELGFGAGDLFIKKQGIKYSRHRMVGVYSTIDCLVNCSLQEGLSLTVLEAMLCETPVIASRTTAQTELLLRDNGILVPCDNVAYIPVMTSRGRSFVETRSPSVEGIGKKFVGEWLAGVSNINDVIRDAVATTKMRSMFISSFAPKRECILFAQHSSAGDVLMTTQTFKGIKDKHPGLPLVYMTQRQYMDIIRGNPYIDEIIPWDESMLTRCEVVYNPHGERILPGGFNSLDVRLHDMYPYFCGVDADEILIVPVQPDIEICNLNNVPADKKIVVVHSTGGNPVYRTYRHFDKALKSPNYYVIQVGDKADYTVRGTDLDLRGKLTWRETAWVLEKADAAVCVDSAPMHMAAALGTNVVALFGPAPARVTGPKPQRGARVIALEPNKLDVCEKLTNCWGELKCDSPCINTINPMKVRKALEELLK